MAIAETFEAEFQTLGRRFARPGGAFFRRAAHLGFFTKILLTGTIFWATPAFAVDVVNKDSKSYTLRVVEPPSTSNVSVPAYTTQMSVCWSCTVEARGLGQVEARPGQTVYIENGVIWAANPAPRGQAYVPSRREQLGLGAPPITGIDPGLPQGGVIPNYNPQPVNPNPNGAPAHPPRYGQ